MSVDLFIQISPRFCQDWDFDNPSWDLSHPKCRQGRRSSSSSAEVLMSHIFEITKNATTMSSIMTPQDEEEHLEGSKVLILMSFIPKPGFVAHFSMIVAKLVYLFEVAVHMAPCSYDSCTVYWRRYSHISPKISNLVASPALTLLRKHCRKRHSTT